MNKCVGSVYNNWDRHSRPCGKNAKYEHEGKHYCGIHYPPNVAKRRAKSRADFDAKYAIEKQRRLENAYTLVSEDLGISINAIKGLGK